MWIFIILIAALIIAFIILSKKADKNKKKYIANEEEINFEDKINGFNKEINIIQISDIHFLSSKLTDYGKAFYENVEKGDAKSVRYVEAIIDAFVYQILNQKPDLVIISGDISYNGERESHIDFSKKLKVLKEHNIDSIVLPGNHDIEYYRVQEFFGDRPGELDSTSVDDFCEIYKEFGMGDNSKIISRDKNSLSYIYKINENICLMLIDTNTKDNIMNISDKTYKWIEKELNSMKESNITTIGVTHQNILGHNKMFISGYKITNSSKLVDLFNKYNVRLNISGHMHAQHIAENKNVYDAAVGSVSLYPNLYANIKIDYRRNIHYSTSKVDVKKWAIENNITNNDLRSFDTYIYNFMEKSTNEKIIESFEKNNIPKNHRKEMLDFLNRTNYAYFSGIMSEYDDLDLEHPGYNLWQNYFERDLFGKYLDSIYQEEKKNHNYLEIKN
ncbi:metallophosphoesterase [Peptostreptococcus equinus]|uniref:Metallophosphoesterase n=1 Tax=Peptostreptococcus equinus TaxID=3003601 RepID=A0ABY7JNI9_9FIRM|nr:metallophosphoesterase [Peptostreptococcus sp. CBA3647]WAW14950.1 metallophosphoesterase [Peptostreptococcus sp. CBA3647]